MMEKTSPYNTVLMTPGPVAVSDSVLQSMSEQVVFHRYVDFQELFRNVQKKSSSVLDADERFTPLLVSGSGSMANETVISSIFDERDFVLVLSNGDFGDRLVNMLRIHNIRNKSYRVDWGEPFEVEKASRFLSNPEITAVAMVAMETSTSMLNPVYDIGKLCNHYNKLFFVDAVSAVGSEKISMVNDFIDVCTTVPNKGLAGPPGIGIICASKSLLENKKDKKPKSFYMDLYRYYEYSHNEQMPTTPAVSIIRALDVALEEVINEGLDNRIIRYNRSMKQLLEALEVFDIVPIIENPRHRANAVTALRFPKEIDIIELHDFFLKKNIVIWKPLHPGPLAPYNCMQISVMGQVLDSAIEYFINTFRDFLKN